MSCPAEPASDNGALVELAVDAASWRAFLGSRPEATPFHHPAWAEALADCYGYRPSVLALSHAGRVVAGIPVMRVGGLGRHRVVALPFTDHLPPLAAGDGWRPALAAGIAAWSREADLPVEVHGDLGPATGADRRMVAVRHVLALPADAAGLVPGFDRNVRQRLNRLSRSSLEAEVDLSPAGLDAFYALHVATRRRLGVPVQPRRFFALIWERVLGAGLGFCIVARLNRRPVAAAVFLEWNQTVIYKYSASEPAHWRAAPNHLLLWTAMQRACAGGRSLFDFGRSDLGSSGLRTFKSEWGATEVPLVAWAAGTTAAPTTRRGQALLAAAIRRSPAAICRLSGRLLYRYFP